MNTEIDLDRAKEKLTYKQKMFVEYYCGEAQGKPVRAARLAGYRHPHVDGPKLMRKPHIHAITHERVHTTAMETDELLERMSDMARVDITDLCGCFYDEPIYAEAKSGGRVEIGKARRIDLRKVRARKIGHLIKKITPTRNGDAVELHDSQKSLETLAKIAGLANHTQHVKVERSEKIEHLVALIKDPSTPLEKIQEIEVELRKLEGGA